VISIELPDRFESLDRTGTDEVMGEPVENIVRPRRLGMQPLDLLDCCFLRPVELDDQASETCDWIPDFAIPERSIEGRAGR